MAMQSQKYGNEDSLALLCYSAEAGGGNSEKYRSGVLIEQSQSHTREKPGTGTGCFTLNLARAVSINHHLESF